MAYVAPNGTIQLFRNIHLTPAYTDTIWFPSLSVQDTYFNNKANYTFANQMYTRVNGNRVRIHVVADRVRDCSYMRFQNIRDNKAKWFYAFIRSVEYINEQVTEVEYEIDEIQTWCFEVSDEDRFAECFIERQHAENDAVGSNLVPEPLNVTENIVSFAEEIYYSQGTNYLVVLGIADATETISGWNDYLYGGLASTVHYIIFESSTQLSTFIDHVNISNGILNGLFGSNDNWAILAVYAVPKRFFTGRGDYITLKNAQCKKMQSVSIQIEKDLIKPAIERGSTLGCDSDGTYTPKNNKLFTYPFSFLRIASPIGEIDLKYELFFGQSSIKLFLKTCCNPEPSILIRPENYNGGENDFRNSMLVDGFPSLTLYQSTQTGELIGRAVRLAATSLANAMGSEGATGSKPKVGLIASNKEAPLLSGAPTTIKAGNATSFAAQFAATGPSINTQITFSIDIYRMGLKKEFAEMFDTYFSRYGYAQNKVAKPNVHARMWWTYIKTRDCRCTVNAPASALQKINAIMNSGITWWDYRVIVGEYGDFTNPTY